MSTTAAIALKEWAAVCAALAAGRQTILLRKGGIAEGPTGFRPEHSEFWLLPTWFHATPEALKPDDRRFFDSVATPPSENCVRIELFARVIEVLYLDREELLQRLADEHVYGAQTVSERFHYRRPGLWLFAVQVFRVPKAVELPVWPQLAGCHSWVELPVALPTDGLTSVLEPVTLAGRLGHLRKVLQPAGVPSAVDMAAIVERFGGDEGLVERLISIYRQDRFPWMSRALGALVQQDGQGLVFAAHRLHGMVSHFDFPPLSEAAARLEELARQADFVAAKDAYGHVEAELAVLDAALDSWQQSR